MGIIFSPCNRAKQKRSNDTPAGNGRGSNSSKVKEIDQTHTRDASADKKGQDDSKSKVV